MLLALSLAHNSNVALQRLITSLGLFVLNCVEKELKTNLLLPYR